MDSPFCFDTKKTWDGPLHNKLLFPNKIVFHSLKIIFVMGNSVDHYEKLHLGLCLPKDAFRSH